jgi:hypothetical protein
MKLEGIAAAIGQQHGGLSATNAAS